MELDPFTKMLGCENNWHTYDIELLSGRRICVNLNPALICHVREIPYNTYSLTWKFPFIKKETKMVTNFVQKKSAERWDDTYREYTVNCSLKAFMGLMGIEPRWNKGMMKADIKYGNHS
jgi:hypothetical protein